MKSFKFSLQAVLTLREEQEQFALQAYAKALMACENADSAMLAAEEDLTTSWSKLQQMLQGQATAAELLQLHNFCATLERHCQECEAAAQLARTVSREAFAQFLLARQARTILERCAEKEKARFDLKRRKQDQKQIDAFSRRSGGWIPLDDEALLRN